MYGLVLAPAYRVTEDLTIDSTYAVSQSMNEILRDRVYSDISYKEGCIYVYDIPDSCKTSDIVVRGYIQVNGEIKYYTATKQISMAEVCYKELDALKGGTSPLVNASDLTKDKDYYINYITDNYLTYTATYYNGSEQIGTATVIYKTSVGQVTEPTKKGHSFTKYYLDSTKTTEYSTSLLKGDVNLYAGFSANNYNLKINYLPVSSDELNTAQFASVSNDMLSYYDKESVTQTVTFGENYSFTVPTITGYTAEQTTGNVTMDEEGKEITVYYTRNSSTLTVSHTNSNNTNLKTETIQVKYGDIIANSYSLLTSNTAQISNTKTSVPTYMTTSNTALTITYSFKDTALQESTSYSGLNIVNSANDLSIKFKLTGASNEWAKLFRIGDILVTNGCIAKYNTTTYSNWENSTQTNKLSNSTHGEQDGCDYGAYAMVSTDSSVEYEVCFKGSNGTIEYYRNGLRIFLFKATTQTTVANGGSTMTVKDIVDHTIKQFNTYGLQVLDGVENNGTNNGAISAIKIRFTPASSRATINYTMNADTATPNNVTYTLLQGVTYSVPVKMPGYAYTTTSTVSNNTITVSGGNTYSVTYNSSTRTTDMLSVDTHKGGNSDDYKTHITRIGEELPLTSYETIGLDKISGNFYLEFYLTDIFMKITDDDDARVKERTPIVQIADGDNGNVWRRFWLSNYTASPTSGGKQFGYVTANNDWEDKKGNTFSNSNYLTKAYIKVVRQGSLIQVSYSIRTEKNDSNYAASLNYRVENITASSVNVSLDAWDSAYCVQSVTMADSTAYSSSNMFPSVRDSSGVGYFNNVYCPSWSDSDRSYAWNNWTNNGGGNETEIGIYKHNKIEDWLYSNTNGKARSTGTGDFTCSYSWYQWGCGGKSLSDLVTVNTDNWNTAKSTAPILFMIQKDSTYNNTSYDETYPHNTYLKAWVGCAYDGNGNVHNAVSGTGQNWFTEGGYQTLDWNIKGTTTTFNNNSYIPYWIYREAYVYYKIKRTGSTITVYQLYIPLGLTDNGNNTSAVKFERTVTLTNVYKNRDSNQGSPDLRIMVAALHGGIEKSGTWRELQDIGSTWYNDSES